MNQNDKNEKIKKILEDLYLIDGEFRLEQKKLEKIIGDILEIKPDLELDDAFKKRLWAELKERIDMQAVRGFRFADLFVPRFAYIAISLAIILTFLMTPDFYPSDDYLIVKSPLPGQVLELERDSKIEVVPATDEARFANPASVYCKEQGGAFEDRMIKEGQKGFCLFDDDSECSQWEFFREECEIGERFCKDLCGDSECQEIVCMAVGCPCAETKENCLQDCE